MYNVFSNPICFCVRTDINIINHPFWHNVHAITLHCTDCISFLITFLSFISCCNIGRAFSLLSCFAFSLMTTSIVIFFNCFHLLLFAFIILSLIISLPLFSVVFDINHYTGSLSLICSMGNVFSLLGL